VRKRSEERGDERDRELQLMKLKLLVSSGKCYRGSPREKGYKFLLAAAA